MERAALEAVCRTAGIKPRWHLLTDGTTVEVAGRLTGLVKPYGSVVTGNWMPRGFESIDEVKLYSPNTFITEKESCKLKDWWFKIPGGSGPAWTWLVNARSQAGPEPGEEFCSSKPRPTGKNWSRSRLARN